MDAETQETIPVVSSEIIAVFGSFYYFFSAVATTMVVVILSLVVTITTAANGLSGLSSFPVSAVAITMAVVAAASFCILGGVTTAHTF